MSGPQRLVALRFMLGLPDAPGAASNGESLDMKKLIGGYGRGFYSRLARVLRMAKLAAARDTSVWWSRSVFERLRWRRLPREMWIARRRLLERWQGHSWVRKCFKALRRWCLRGGPSTHNFWLREIKGHALFGRRLAYAAKDDNLVFRRYSVTELDASREWEIYALWLRWRRVAGYSVLAESNRCLWAAKALVHFRAAGVDALEEAGRRCALLAAETEEVRRHLDRIICKVVRAEAREAERCSNIFRSLIRRLYAAASKAESPSNNMLGRRRAEVRQAVEGGERPVRLGGSMWKIERIMSVRRSTGGEVSALVRWAGNHSHTWEPLESFPGDELKAGVIGRRPKRRRLERLANAVLGYPPP